MREVTIVGGGVAGLVAAISAAEAGTRVALHEASGRLGGRGATSSGPHRVNLGPHALYRHGAFEAWLVERGLLPPVYYPSLSGFRIRSGGRLRRLPPQLWKLMRSASWDAPVDETYRAFASARMGREATEAAIGMASLPTFHPDPGTLSAAFVQERLARSSLWRPVYYVRGGWGELVGALERRARELGVEVAMRSKLAALPEGPTVVATDLPAAAHLLGDERLAWPGPRTVQLDVSLRPARRDPTAVLDLDERVYATRTSAGDATVAPAGESLVQAVAGVRDGESDPAALERVRSVLDAGYAGWRERAEWQRSGALAGGAGPSDEPGVCWRDRPSIEQGPGRWLAGDKVAAPGLLSEVSFESGRQAGLAAAAAARGRASLHAA